MPTRKFTKEQKAAWLEELRQDLKPGDTLHMIVRKVSASGMSRHIDVYRFAVDGGQVRKYWMSSRIAAVAGFTFDDRHECLKVSGCGMDMCWHVGYTLGRVLWPEGFGLEGAYPNGSTGRPATREQAAKCVEAGVQFRGRNGGQSGWESDGGYALKVEQI